MKVVVASLLCIIAALVGLGFFRLWLVHDARKFAAQVSQKAEDRRMEEQRQKVRDWLTASIEVQRASELMRRQIQQRQLSDLVWLPSAGEVEIGAANLRCRPSNFSLEPCTLWQRQMEKLREELGLPPLREWQM